MTLHHRFDGDPKAPVLLLSCSLGTTLALWEPQLRALGARFRVLRYDHPGHGGTPVPEGPQSLDDWGRGVLDLLDELGLQRVACAGLSLGGLVGMWLGSRAPERLTRLALCCTAARFPPPARWDERAAIVRSDGVEGVAEAVLERWFTPGLRASSPELVEHYRRMLLSIPAEGYARGCDVVRDADLRGHLGSIPVPTLVLAGSDDPAVTPHDVGELVDGIPDARVVRLRRAAHLANAEQPDAFTAALLDHLEVAAAA